MTTTNPGSVGISLYPGSDMRARLNPGAGEPVAVLHLSEYPAYAYIALRTVAEVDALIRAAVEAKNLLIGAGLPPGPAPDGGCLPGCPGCAWCKPGHHADCGPGRCTCGATVSAAGKVTPAVTP
jgi:hypothetical protein